MPEGIDGRRAAAIGGAALALLLVLGLAAWALRPAPTFWVRIPEGTTYGPMTVGEFNDLFDARWDEVVVCRVGASSWTTVQQEPYLARDEAAPTPVVGGERYDFGIPAYAQRGGAPAPAAAPAPRVQGRVAAATTPGERKNLIEQALDAPQTQRRRAAVFGAGAANAGAAAAGSVSQASKK